MGLMKEIRATIDGTEYSFRLFDHNIEVLTFEDANAPSMHLHENIRMRDLFYQKCRLLNIQLPAPNPARPWKMRGFLYAIVPKAKQLLSADPSGKSLLIAAAEHLAARHPYTDPVRVVLMQAIHAAGNNCRAHNYNDAAALANRLVQSQQTTPDGKNFVGQWLVPEILRGAAEA
jgi:hypothetical protein